MTRGTLFPKGPPLRRPNACRLSFSATSCTSALTFGSRALSCFPLLSARLIVLIRIKSGQVMTQGALDGVAEVSGKTPG